MFISCTRAYASREQGLYSFHGYCLSTWYLVSHLKRAEWILFKLTYHISWASLVAQLVKNPPEMQETSIGFLGCKDPLEKGMATHSSILAWRIPMDRGAWQTTVRGFTRVEYNLATIPPPWPQYASHCAKHFTSSSHSNSKEMMLLTFLL